MSISLHFMICVENILILQDNKSCTTIQRHHITCAGVTNSYMDGGPSQGTKHAGIITPGKQGMDDRHSFHLRDCFLGVYNVNLASPRTHGGLPSDVNKNSITG